MYILPNESISGSTKVSRRLTLHLTGTIKNKKLKENWLKKVDQFFLWGKSHFKVLKNYSKKLSKKSFIVGHPRHENIYYKNFNNKNIYKKKIWLISRFDLINIFDNRHNFEHVYNAWLDKFNFQWMFDDKRNTEHQWFNSISDFRFFLDIIKLLSNKRYQVSLRPHPRENRDNWIKFKKKYNLNIKISADEEPFLNWIASQDILVSSASTSLYDCVLMKKK